MEPLFLTHARIGELVAFMHALTVRNSVKKRFSWPASVPDEPEND